MSLVVAYWRVLPALRLTTYIFLGVFGLFVVILTIVLIYKSDDDDCDDAVQSFIVYGLCLLLIPLYADWALGTITHNLTGLPSAGNGALLWTFWVSKRLTMLFT